MADEVEIGNIGGKTGVASEATLERLVKILEKQNRSGGSGASGDDIKKLAKESKDASKEVGEFSDEIAETTTFVEDLGSAASKAGSGLLGLTGSALSGIYDSATGLATELINGGDRMSNFVKHVPLVGGVFAGVAKYFEDGVDAFRSLSENGASFGNSLIELKQSAAAAEMPLDMFQNVIGQNAASMQLLGGTVTEGAKEFGKLQKNLRESSPNLLALGYEVESLAEHTAGYLELQARLGRVQGMSQAQLTQGASDYLVELDRLAKVTGMSRKEAERLMKEQAQEANVASIQSRLSGDALKNFQSGLAFVENQMPGLTTAFKDLADGIPQTEIGQKIASLSPGLATLFEQVGKGQVPLEELQQGLKDNLPALTKLRDSMGGAAVSALMGEAGFGELFQSIHEADVFLSKTFDPKRAEAEQKERDRATEELAGFEAVVYKVRSAFTTAFINSGILQSLGGELGDMTELFKDAGVGLANLIEGIGKSDEFQTVVANITTVINNLKDNFAAIASDIGSFNFSAALDKLFSGTKNPFSSGGAGASAAGGDSAVSSQTASEAGESKGILGGLLDAAMSLLDITWGDIALGIGLVVGTVTAIGYAAVAASPGLLAVGVALKGVGVAALGIGAALAGASLLVSELGDAISGVIDSISNLMTAQQNATTDQIQQLTQIDDQAMHDAAAGITAMKEALEGFGPGMLDSIGGAIGGLLGDDMGDQVNYMKQIATLGPGLSQSAAGLSAMKEALEGLGPGMLDSISGAMRDLVGHDMGDQAQYMKQIAGVGPELSIAGEGMAAISSAAKELDDSNIRAYTEAVEELVEAMKDLNDELSRDNNGTFTPGTGANAGNVLGGMSGGGTAEKLDQLNMLMTQMLQVLTQNARYSRDTTRAIRGQGDLYQGN